MIDLTKRTKCSLRSRLVLICLSLWMAPGLEAASLPTLFNTGIDHLGNRLPDDATDPHYRLGPQSPLSGPAFVATSAGGFPIGPWLPDGTDSAWVSPSRNTSGPAGRYYYETEFDLTGFDISATAINGRWSAAGSGADILINGRSTGQINARGYDDWYDFRVTAGFIPGINRLTFVVDHTPQSGVNATGIRVEMSGGSLPLSHAACLDFTTLVPSYGALPFSEADILDLPSLADKLTRLASSGVVYDYLKAILSHTTKSTLVAYLGGAPVEHQLKTLIAEDLMWGASAYRLYDPATMVLRPETAKLMTLYSSGPATFSSARLNKLFLEDTISELSKKSGFSYPNPWNYQGLQIESFTFDSLTRPENELGEFGIPFFGLYLDYGMNIDLPQACDQVLLQVANFATCEVFALDLHGNVLSSDSALHNSVVYLTLNGPGIRRLTFRAQGEATLLRLCACCPDLRLTQQPQISPPQTCLGQPVTLSVTAQGSNLSYAWRKLGDPTVRSTSPSWTFIPTTKADAGKYFVTVTSECTSVDSQQIELSLEDLLILRQPLAQRVCRGADVTLEVDVQGNNPHYAWYKVGNPSSVLSVSRAFTLKNALPSDSGEYAVRVETCGQSILSSPARITVIEPPVLTAPPQLKESCVGTTVTFQIATTGNDLNYEWRRGATIQATTTIAEWKYGPVRADDATAKFSVRIYNDCGELFVDLALAAKLAPTILNSPQSQKGCSGMTVHFTAAAEGSSPMQYQWLRNGTPLGAASSDPQLSYTIPSGDTSASFAVRVINDCGSAVSTPAVLTVDEPDEIRLSNASADCLKGRFRFTLQQRSGALPADWVINDASHYDITWRDTSGTGRLRIGSVLSTPDASAWHITLISQDPLPAKGATYTLTASSFLGGCSQTSPPVSIIVPCDAVVEGTVFRHASAPDCQASPSAGEYGLLGRVVTAHHTITGDTSVALSDTNGRYQLSLPPGDYLVTVDPGLNWAQQCPAGTAGHLVSLSAGQTRASLDFALKATSLESDLSITVNAFAAKADHTPDPRRTPCPGQEAVIVLNYHNPGTLRARNGIVRLAMNSGFANFISADPPSVCPTSASDPLSWCIPTLFSGRSGEIRVRVMLSNGAGLDNLITATIFDRTASGTGWTLLTDANPADNTATLAVPTECAFDPNHLSVSPAGCGPQGLVPMGTELTYTVQFHNLGNGPAYDVSVTDLLPVELDATTLRMIASSHPYILQIDPDANSVIWSMPNIRLSPDQTDPQGSHGFITYAIRPQTTLPPGSEVINQAAVIFDLNPEIYTSKTTNVFVQDTAPQAAFTPSRHYTARGQANSFSYAGGTVGAAFRWEFGPDAKPQTSTEANPKGVIYTQLGLKQVVLHVVLGTCETVAVGTVEVVEASQLEPRLHISQIDESPNVVRLDWGLPDWKLESSSDTSLTTWESVADVPPTFMPAAKLGQFFRLRKE